MKIPVGGGGYLEPDEGPRDTQYHMKILRVAPIPGYRAANYVELECGHAVTMFGRLEHAEGVVLCTACRDKASQ